MTRPSRTILVIDDAPVDREIYVRLLGRAQHQDYTVLEAESGSEGLALLAEHEVDCIVLDFNLPDADGLDILDQLRQGFPQEIPVVMLTGAGSEAIAVETMKRGCEDYIIKTDATVSRLTQAIENAIEKVRLRDEIERKRADLEASQREQIELKNRFLSHVSHELRTPLTAVHQFLSLCLDGIAGDLTETQREYLEIAQRNASQLKSMIGDLMEVTRAEAGKLRIELAPMQVGPLIDELVSTHRSAATTKGIALAADVNETLRSVLADEGRVRQVLGNLIENAMKFTPEGGSIRVSAAADSADASFLRVSVADTGCGIKSGSEKTIFSRLHQENLTSEDTRQGLGLGLSICRELICLQRGRIWAESEEGAGSTFHFTLPMYSLSRMVAPALVSEDRMRPSYVLLRVSIASKDAGNSPRLSDEQSRSIHHLLGKLVYYPYDVVLPRLRPADLNYAVVATDADGMKAVLPRIRERLKSHLATKLPHAELRVDGRVEEICERDLEGPLELAVDNAARRIEELMRDASQWGE